MKYLIAIIVIVSLLTGGWYGFSAQRRKIMLNSGRPLLLLNKKAGTYTYSDLIDREDIGRSLKIAGYADELSPEEIVRLTSGLNIFMGLAPSADDTRVPRAAEVFSVIPTPEEQRRWNTALATLTEEQRQLCAAIQDAALIQPCLSRHLVFVAVKDIRNAEICDSIYINDQREACRTAIAAGTTDGFIDVDNDQLLDIFEWHIIPYDQRTNLLNLPIVNPAE